MAAKKNSKSKSETTYKIDAGRLAAQLAKDDSSNWLIERGIQQFKEGKIPGKLMLAFLEHIKVLTIE